MSAFYGRYRQRSAAIAAIGRVSIVADLPVNA